MRCGPLALLAVLIGVPCTAPVGAGTASPTVARPASPAAAASPSSSPPPAIFGRDPALGAFSFNDIGSGAWRFDPAKGDLRAEPAQSPPDIGGTSDYVVAVSPSGRYEALAHLVRSGSIADDRNELWLVDRVTRAARTLFVPPPQRFSAKPGATPSSGPQPARIYADRSFYFGSWSPDDRYIAFWSLDILSGSISADGRPLAIVDTLTAETVELGKTLLSSPPWRAPHTLAYVAGAGRITTDHKQLRTWSPETGSRAVSAAGEIGLSPAWAPDGRLYFIRAPEGQWDPRGLMGGTGVGDRRAVVVDLASGGRADLARLPGFSTVGVSVPPAGRRLLRLEKRLDPAATLTTPDPNMWLELWSSDTDGTNPLPLLRLRQQPFGYYAAYDLDRYGFYGLRLVWR